MQLCKYELGGTPKKARIRDKNRCFRIIVGAQLFLSFGAF
jgi:hypothetical protein